MAQQTVNLGTSANDGTGDDLRTGGGKINDNFTEIYSGTFAANLTAAGVDTDQLGLHNGAFKTDVKSENLTQDRELIADDEDGIIATREYENQRTGWEAVVDTDDTVGSPQTVVQGVTANLTNNAGTLFNTQLPTGVATFWDDTNSKIIPENENDFMTASFMFKAKNDNIDGHFTIYIDIPSLGERFTTVHRFPKGANTEHGFDIDICHFVSSQFAANGGIVKITADLGDLEIYDKQFRFCRVHKAL